MTNLSGIANKPSKYILLLALLLILSAQGCAQKNVTSAPPVPMSKSAELSYDYLVYMDYRSELGQIMAGPRTPQTINRAAKIQQEALVVLNRIIAVEPTVQLYMDKFALYWTSQQIDEARATLKDALEIYQDNRELTISLANTYLIDGRNDDAISVLNEYLHKKPDDLTVTAHLARIYLDQKKFAQALDILKAVPVDKRTAQIYYLHGKASAGLGLSKQAIKSFRSAVKANPNMIEAWGELAYLHEIEKNYAEAERIYFKMLEFPDVSSHIRIRLLELSLKQNNPEQALDLAFDGPRTEAFLLEATQAFLNGNFFGQASIVLDLFAQQKPIPDAYYFFKASIAYEGEDDPAKALNFLNKINPESDHFDRSLQFKAHLLVELNRDAEALETIQEGQEQFPEDVNFYLLEAAMHVSAGNDALAEKALLKGNENLPDNPKILFQLGLMEEKKGNIEKTISYMEQVISNYPDHSDALNFVGYLLADRNEQLDRAQVLIKRADRLEPDNGYILDSLAWVNYRMGNFDEAWETINRAVALKPKQHELWEHYAEIALALGKKKEAAKGYKKALSLNPANSKEIRKKLEAL